MLCVHISSKWNHSIGTILSFHLLITNKFYGHNHPLYSFKKVWYFSIASVTVTDLMNILAISEHCCYHQCPKQHTCYIYVFFKQQLWNEWVKFWVNVCYWHRYAISSPGSEAWPKHKCWENGHQSFSPQILWLAACFSEETAPTEIS